MLLASQQLLGAQAQAQEDDDDPWKVRFFKNEPYLTLETIQKQYGFTDLATQGEGFELGSPTAVIQGRVGVPSMLVNRLRYQLHLEPKQSGSRFLLSAYDLTNVIDLLLRPGNHMQPAPLKTVYVQPIADEFAVEPSARVLAFQLQEILRDYGLAVRFLDPDSMGIVGDALEVEAESGAIWLRLQGNGRLLDRNLRCTVLAPPGAPARKTDFKATESDEAAVHLGNLYDGESLALATLIQSGLVFGPGARNGGAVDAGIRQWPVEPFQRGSGAAVHIEWGADVTPEHLLKAITAGIVRYGGFVSVAAEQVQAMTKARDPLVKAGDVKLRLRDEDGMLEVKVGLARARSLDGKLDPTKVDVQVFLFSREGESAIDLIQTPPPKVSWVSLLADWTLDDPETVELLYHIGKDDAGEFRRTSFGYVVRVAYDGKFQDAAAEPQGLLNQLWRFSAIFPR